MASSPTAMTALMMKDDETLDLEKKINDLDNQLTLNR